MKCLPILATLSILLFCNSIFAQRKSFPGYYIGQQGDTARGMFLTYTQWTKNPSQVDFLIEGATGPIHLTPQNTRKFVVEGYDEYLSYTGQRLVNPIVDATLFNERFDMSYQDSTQQISTFLRLVKRTVGGDLYIFHDARRINFYFQLPGQPLIELRYKKALNQNQIHEMADYRQQLYTLFGEAITERNLKTALERLPYLEAEMSSFLEKLFPGTTPQRTKQNRKTEWVISAGAVVNMVNVQADKSFNSVPRTYASSFSPLVSAGLVVFIGRNFGKYFLTPQVKLFRYKNTGEENQGTFINTVTYQADLAVAPQLNAGVNLINREAFRLFFTAGVGMIAQVNPKQVRQLYTSGGTLYSGPVETELPSLVYSFDASTGVVIKNKVFLSASYMPPTHIGNFLFYSPKLSGAQFRIGYKL